MSSSVFRGCVESLGVCCPAQYIFLTRRKTPQAIADHLGVHVRTVRYWRYWVRTKKVVCEQKDCCARGQTTQGLPQIKIHRCR